MKQKTILYILLLFSLLSLVFLLCPSPKEFFSACVACSQGRKLFNS